GTDSEHEKRQTAADPVGEQTTGYVSEEGGDNRDGEVRRRIQHRQTALRPQECRKPRCDGVVTALRAHSHDAAKDSNPEQRRLEDFPERRFVTCCSDLGFRGDVYRRLFDVAPNEENRNCGSNAHKEQQAPRELGREKRKEQRIQKRRSSPAESPARLHRAESLTSMLRTDRLSEQYGTSRPFATETKSEQSARGEQLLEVLCETGKE